MDVLTLVEGAGSCHSCNEDGTVDAIGDLQAVDVLSDVKVGVFTANNSDIFAFVEVLVVSHRDSLVQKGHVLDS